MSIKTGTMGAGAGGGGGSQNLQQVTDVGNTTTNPINLKVGANIFQLLGPIGMTSSEIGLMPNVGGLFQVDSNGLKLPEKTIAAGAAYHPVREDHVIFVNLSAGGTKDVQLDNTLLAFPGLQVVVKIISFGGAAPGLKIFPESGTIDGQADIIYSAINLFAVRVVNDGTNWWVVDVMTGSEIVKGAAPTVTTVLARGGVPSISADSRDNVGFITFSFGASVTDAVPFMRLNFARAWPTVPRAVLLQPAGCDAVGRVVAYYAVTIPPATITTTSFTMVTPNDGTNSLVSTICSWMYTVIQ